MGDQSRVGKIEWVDLTVPDAESLRDFYAQVVGWKPSPVKMGAYSDYNMCSPADENPAVGVCHARGVNAKIPAQWLIYVVVADLQQSIQKCESLGGKVLGKHGKDHCLIQDPAGAVMMLGQV
jgi:predicted enzyme related to lactoylglutathione lyase